MKYVILCSLLLTACSEYKCVDSREVSKILAVRGQNKAVELKDGTVYITNKSEVIPGGSVCLNYESTK